MFSCWLLVLPKISFWQVSTKIQSLVCCTYFSGYTSMVRYKTFSLFIFDWLVTLKWLLQLELGEKHAAKVIKLLFHSEHYTIWEAVHLCLRVWLFLESLGFVVRITQLYGQGCASISCLTQCALLVCSFQGMIMLMLVGFCFGGSVGVKYISLAVNWWKLETSDLWLWWLNLFPYRG